MPKIKLTAPQRIPNGSITWYEGEVLQGRGKSRVSLPVWKYITPEDSMAGARPRILYAPPIGAVRTGLRTVSDTVQVIQLPDEGEGEFLDGGFSGAPAVINGINRPQMSQRVPQRVITRSPSPATTLGGFGVQ